MIKVAIITRSSLYSVKGGDTIQVVETARALNKIGIVVRIYLADGQIDYAQYDLLHFFNITRPADMIFHIEKSGKPFLLSPVFVEYAGFDKHGRKGISGFFAKYLAADQFEYLKTIARCLNGTDRLISKKYIWMGQAKSIRKILRSASLLLPNSFSEYRRLQKAYGLSPACSIIVNGVDADLFTPMGSVERDPCLVLSVGRIEGIKNQLNLIRALNNTSFRLLVIGKPAPNQLSYYQECRKLAATNIEFIDHLPQQELLHFYAKATVHALPSFFETTGLSSLEAAAMGCHIVVSKRGDVYDYFGEDALYCDPDSPESIFQAVSSAAAKNKNPLLQKKVIEKYNWQQAAIATAAAYRKVYAAQSIEDRDTGNKRHP